MTGFAQGINTVLSSEITKYLVLGDSSHGTTSLNCLAAAIQAGALHPLSQYKVSTVLFEGARRGQELTANHGAFAKAVTILAKNGVLVYGCEDDKSLSTEAQADKMYLNAGSYGDSFQSELQKVMDKRIPDANDSWLAQALSAKPKVIICCGTSHLPQYNHLTHGHMGLIKALDQHGLCYGFAVEASNTDDPYWYEPEQPKGVFGKVETIDEYPGWDNL